jgi:hypothetical protein
VLAKRFGQLVAAQMGLGIRRKQGDPDSERLAKKLLENARN